jgi:2Fe-2S ferredoxin
VGDEIY